MILTVPTAATCYALHERVVGDATATTLSTTSNRVPERETWLIQHIAVYNDTTDDAECQVSIDLSGFNHVIATTGPLAATEYYAIQLDLLLMPRDRLRFDWTSIASGDHLEMHITGIRIKETD